MRRLILVIAAAALLAPFAIPVQAHQSNPIQEFSAAKAKKAKVKKGKVKKEEYLRAVPSK